MALFIDDLDAASIVHEITTSIVKRDGGGEEEREIARTQAILCNESQKPG